jgi:hypothetical protein
MESMLRSKDEISGSYIGATLEDKALQLEVVLAQPTVDLWELRELALSEGGLVNGMSFVVRSHASVCGL